MPKTKEPITLSHDEATLAKLEPKIRCILNKVSSRSRFDPYVEPCRHCPEDALTTCKALYKQILDDMQNWK